RAANRTAGMLRRTPSVRAAQMPAPTSSRQRPRGASRRLPWLALTSFTYGVRLRGHHRCMNERENRNPPSPEQPDPEPAEEAPEQITGGTGTLPSEGVP